MCKNGEKATYRRRQKKTPQPPPVENVTIKIRISPRLRRKRNYPQTVAELDQGTAKCKGVVEEMSRLQVRTASRPLDPGPHSRRKPQEIHPKARSRRRTAAPDPRIVVLLHEALLNSHLVLGEDLEDLLRAYVLDLFHETQQKLSWEKTLETNRRSGTAVLSLPKNPLWSSSWALPSTLVMLNAVSSVRALVPLGARETLSKEATHDGQSLPGNNSRKSVAHHRTCLAHTRHADGKNTHDRTHVEPQHNEKHTTFSVSTHTENENKASFFTDISLVESNKTSFSLFGPLGICELKTNRDKSTRTAPAIAMLATFLDKWRKSSAQEHYDVGCE